MVSASLSGNHSFSGLKWSSWIWHLPATMLITAAAHWKVLSLKPVSLALSTMCVTQYVIETYSHPKVNRFFVDLYMKARYCRQYDTWAVCSVNKTSQNAQRQQCCFYHLPNILSYHFPNVKICCFFFGFMSLHLIYFIFLHSIFALFPTLNCNNCTTISLEINKVLLNWFSTLGSRFDVYLKYCGFCTQPNLCLYKTVASI